MESEIIFRRSGYEYRYRIGMDDDIITLYQEQLDHSCACDRRSFILEVRTNFVLKPSPGGGEQVMDSERFVNIFPVSVYLPARLDEERMYLVSISCRLRDYWLPENEIEGIAREAFYFAKRMAADPQNASLNVIPLVVYIDVCTVQLRGESLDATILRLIKPDCLIPIELWGMSLVRKGEENWASVKWMYLLRLPKERVLEDDVARIEACPICSEAPSYGTLITPLPNCNHVFHNHCVVRWLMNNKSAACPVCSSEIELIYE